ncbi:hypothetical protein EPUS_00595 [Endocarpon pusillum Z07020]|uniref:RRM domain-containing protein n=1 Tax=Endocarpon pusillum (strain Z07020 / HMAS-L-300199) TaxID=1263415 RepID=U1GIH3_ENDPU|nr:uncharacterized protein EPUS_00595 [Endocarpon pusillum Z07020]ERF71606.1 hypothetical protein EPUS_00595 [Endocarpon pusillum Z07020]
MPGNKPFNIDDIGNVNSFLALIGGSQVSSPPEAERTTVSASERSSVAPPSGLAAAGIDVLKQDRPVPNRHSQLIPALAASGRAAPPSTPTAGTVAASNTTLTSLDHIEDGSDILRAIANASNLTLNDSVHAPKNFRRTRAQNPDLKYATMPARHAPYSYNSFDENYNRESLSKMKKSEQEKLIPKYQDEVIANFVREKSPEMENKAEPTKEPESGLPDRNTNVTVSDSSSKVTQSTKETPEPTNKATNYPKMSITTAPGEATDDDDGQKDDGNSEKEDREHLKHFKSWGKPEPRNGPTARIRKVILSNLPADSDLTLVQSLVYGGALESFNLMASKTSAYVTFVDADACDAFFDAHPNGLVFKNPKTRRNHVVYVAKGQDVDVVSSVLRAYLDCQASRVVRATGADEDWGMGALYKLAESKNRKVETIVDTYRDKVRTIIFRFTNIADAVTFRGQLLRDEDWEMCNIQFMDDPVQKATGVHLEE